MGGYSEAMKDSFMTDKEKNDLEAANVKTYPSRWHFICERTANLVKEKNAAYGDSFAQAEEVFKLLFPNGVPADRVGDLLFMARMWDKFKRFATKPDAYGENPVADMHGYCTLYLELHERNGSSK